MELQQNDKMQNYKTASPIGINGTGVKGNRKEAQSNLDTVLAQLKPFISCQKIGSQLSIKLKWPYLISSKMMKTKFEWDISVIKDITAPLICIESRYRGEERQMSQTKYPTTVKRPLHGVLSHDKRFPMKPFFMLIIFPIKAHGNFIEENANEV